MLFDPSSGRSFLRRSVDGGNYLSWIAAFGDGITTAAVWLDVDALVAYPSNGGAGRNMLLHRVGASPVEQGEYTNLSSMGS